MLEIALIKNEIDSHLIENRKKVEAGTWTEDNFKKAKKQLDSWRIALAASIAEWDLVLLLCPYLNLISQVFTH